MCKDKVFYWEKQQILQYCALNVDVNWQILKNHSHPIANFRFSF